MATKTELIRFESELLEQNLPDRPSISLSEAVAWLAGLDAHQTEATVRQTPDSRSRAQLFGKSLNSAGFWSHVFAWVQKVENAEDATLDWSMLEFVSRKRLPKDTKRQKKFEELALFICPRFSKNQGKTLEQICSKFETVRETEVERIWAVRESMLRLVANIEHLFSETLFKEPEQPLAIDESYHLSLFRNSLAVRANFADVQSSSVDLWSPRHDQFIRRGIQSDVHFERDALLQCFLHGPNERKSNWVKERLADRNWPVLFAALYMTHEGDWDRLVHRTMDINSAIDLPRLSSFQLDNEHFYFSCSDSQFLEIEGLLRRGLLKAEGVPADGMQSVDIPAHDFHFLSFYYDADNRALRLRDESRLTSARWEHVSLRVDSVNAECPSKPLSGKVHVRSNVSAETHALRRATTFVEQYKKQWTLHKKLIQAQLTTDGVELGERAWGRLFASLNIKYPWLARKGKRPNQRPSDWDEVIKTQRQF